MVALVFILIIFLALVAIVVPVVVFQTRTRVRERKNYERGLKIVPLLIHLPPPSEDIEGSGRDVRDVVDENISRAQYYRQYSTERI